jgi:hypothetical protein
LTDLTLLPKTSVSRYPTVPFSPPFDITYPRPKTTIPIGQVQRSMLERNSAGFKVDHLSGVSITHWSEEGETRLVINRNGDVRSKFLGRLMSRLQGKKDFSI